MPSIYNQATNAVETLEERYQREAEIDARIEEKVRMEQAMRAVDEVSKKHNRTAMTYGVCTKPSIGIWPESMQPQTGGEQLESEGCDLLAVTNQKE